MSGTETVSGFTLAGAICFGALVGWYLYYINRHRTDKVTLQDLATIIGALGGAAILAIFPARSALFGGYGVGLAGGFFGYFVVLLFMVRVSPKFSVEWFLDGRRKKLDGDEYIPGYDERGVALAKPGQIQPEPRFMARPPVTSPEESPVPNAAATAGGGAESGPGVGDPNEPRSK